MGGNTRMSNNKIGVGIAGTGYGRMVQMPAVTESPDFELVSVFSRSMANANSAATEFGVPQATDDFSQMLANDDVDVVLISTPPLQHAEMSIGAFEAGKHVICEKPISADTISAERMLQAAEANDRLHAIGFDQRYVPACRTFRDLIDDGYIGQLRHFDVRLFVPLALYPMMPFYHYSWRDDAVNGSGVLSGVFAHYLDLMMHNFGDVSFVAGKATTAVTSKPHHPESGQEGTAPVSSDDRVVIAGELANGSLFSMAGSWSVHHGAGLRIEAFGDEGTLVMPDYDQLEGARQGESGLTPIASAYPPSRPVHGHGGGFPYLLADFGKSIHGRQPDQDNPEYATFHDGLRVQEVLDAVKNQP